MENLQNIEQLDDEGDDGDRTELEIHNEPTNKGDSHIDSPKDSSSVPEWLQQRLENKAPQVEIMTLDLDALLARLEKPKKQKNAEIQSRIHKDATGLEL